MQSKHLRFYLNVVGYKDGKIAVSAVAISVFYLNVVGYKDGGMSCCTLKCMSVLSERSGI